uniref:WRKY33-2_1 n=1 Tax=Reaumuria trigyna TaxID=1091135 RepID=U5YCI6_9CARY|nr:WRKY33-2_1 [Reaumuria trigyna]
MSSSVAGLDNLSPNSTFSFSNLMSSSCSSPITDFLTPYYTTCDENNTSRSDKEEKANTGSWAFLDNLTGGNYDSDEGVGVPKFKSLAPPQLPFSPAPASPPFLAAITNTNSTTAPGAAPFSPSMFLDSPLLFPNSNNFSSPTVGALNGEGFNWASYNSTSNNNQQRSVRQDESSKNNQQNYHDFSFLSRSVPTTTDISTESSWSLQESTTNHQNEIKSSTVTTTITNTNPAAALQPNNQRGSCPPQFMRATKRSDDGYNWRKYGQKQVKGSENPRSYFKCSYPNCQTKKKVERSVVDGHITEIVYKGSHNHPKPLPRKSSSISHEIGSSSDTNVMINNNCSQMEYSMVNITPETTSSVSLEDDDLDHNSSAMSKPRTREDDMETDAKRWKGENETEEMSAYGSRAVREPRIVVQTTSEIDILDDGYRWRKYGQKVVKGNPNPRSYYKCTSSGCPVRKHIERASQDLRAVITTYEGKHNHDVPAARGSNYNNINRVPNISPSIVPPVRPSAISHQQYNGSTNNSLLSGQSQVYTLQMLQSGTTTDGTNYGYSSGFGNNPSGSFINQMQKNGGIYSRAKEEQTDNPFLEALLH